MKKDKKKKKQKQESVLKDSRKAAFMGSILGAYLMKKMKGNKLNMKKSRINWAIERGCFYSIPRKIEQAFWLEIRRPMPFKKFVHLVKFGL